MSQKAKFTVSKDATRGEGLKGLKPPLHPFPTLAGSKLRKKIKRFNF